MHLITNQQQLAEFVKEVKINNNYIAIDTEFKRQNTYYPILALIQIAYKNKCVIIDPIVYKLDYNDFFDLLSDKNILKVFFAARQDIELLYLTSSRLAYPVFDCQIAAMLCGYRNNISFQKIVAEMLNYTIDKAQQQTDWTQRPLSPQQLDYASRDAIYLYQLYKQIIIKLKEINRYDWLKGEFDKLSERSTYVINEEQIWQKLRYRCNNNWQFWLMQNLCAWRENKAKTLDLPRQWIISDTNLCQIISCKNENLLEFVNKKLKLTQMELKPEIVTIIENGLRLEKSDLPKLQRYNPAFFNKSKKLKKLQNELNKTAEDHKIDPAIITNINGLKKFLEAPQDKTLPIMQGWRYEIFGKYAKDIIIK